MGREISKRKIIAPCILGLAAFTIASVSAHVLIPAELKVSASVEETPDQIKVFIGDVDHASENYVQQRSGYVQDVANTDTDKALEAVIGLNNYYTIDEIVALVEDYNIGVNCVYMWPKGETGRLALSVENDDIDSSIKEYMNWVDSSGVCENDPEFAADYQRFLDGEYEVFAVTATATAEDLAELNDKADCISYVDVKQNAEVEKYAKKAGKAVSYIELPSKPDGAL